MRKQNFMTVVVLSLLGIFLLVPSPTFAYQYGGQAYAVRIDDDIWLDGDFWEAAWTRAIPIYLVEDLVAPWQEYMTHVTWGVLPEDSTDLSMMALFLWDDENFYIGAKVNDSILVFDHENPYETDAIELFFDPSNEGRVIYQEFAGLKSMNGDEPYVSIPGAEIAGLENDLLPPFGYSLEIAIPWSAMKDHLGMDKPEVGTTIGFDIQVNDADIAGQGRQKALVWSGGENRNWLDASVFGQLTFIGSIQF